MKIVFTLILFLSTLLSFAQDKKAQKKEEYKLSTTLKTVRGYLKDDKYSDANNEIEKAVKAHKEAQQSAQIYALKSNALYNLALEENKKMFLKQKTDTTKYYSYISSLYEAALTCDSLEQIPNEKGKVNIKSRSTNQSRLLQFRKNLATADRFYYQHQDFKSAYRFADLYLSSRKAPIFTSSKTGLSLADESDTIAHAKMAVFLAFAYNNYEGVKKYLPMAQLDTARLMQLYEVGAQSYYATGDTIEGNRYLQLGVEKFPTNEYFYMTLLMYHNSKKDYASGLTLLQSILKSSPDNRNCLFLKSRQLELLNDLDGSIATMERVVEVSPEDYEAYSHLGNMYVEKAQNEYRNSNLRVTDKKYQQNKGNVTSFYQHAKEAFELCRKFAAKETSLWLAGLRECYYKLNLGKELKALEKIK